MVSLIIKDTDDRLVEGWASVEIEDLDDEIVPLKELHKAMVKFMSRGGDVFFAHKNKKVGKVINWWIDKNDKTGEKGVRVLALINRGYDDDDVAWKGIKEGKLKGFSIGGKSEREEKMMKDASTGMMKPLRILKNLQLGELSLVEKPANPFAIIEDFNEFAKGETTVKTIYERFNVDGKSVYDEKKNIRGCNVCKAVKEEYMDEIAISLYGDIYTDLDKVKKSVIDGLMSKFDEMVATIGSIFEKDFKSESDISDENELIKKILDDMDRLEKAEYDWDECMNDQMEQYGDKEIAQKVCGKIKATNKGCKKPKKTKKKDIDIAGIKKDIKTLHDIVKKEGKRYEITEIIDQIRQKVYGDVAEGEAPKKSDAAKDDMDESNSIRQKYNKTYDAIDIIKRKVKPESAERLPEVHRGEEAYGDRDYANEEPDEEDDIEGKPSLRRDADDVDEKDRKYITHEVAMRYKRRGIPVYRGKRGGHFIELHRVQPDMQHKENYKPIKDAVDGDMLIDKENGKKYKVTGRERDGDHITYKLQRQDGQELSYTEDELHNRFYALGEKEDKKE